ncbi:hypothetical protein FACS1894188_07240 [Clostridia bacterium]|nr:hypothetical protein FACS1894188_07240 [Clostridia bacterium]
MAKLLYQGHGSYRIMTWDGKVIYVDPYAGKGYDLPADCVLVTHQHHDHNKVKLITQKPNCRVITNVEALEGGKHNSFSFDEIEIEAVEARNLFHSPKKCVGYVIAVDGVKIYASGDTSKTEQMSTLAEREIDYALFPCGGALMNLKEAAECARIVKAKHNIPIHIKPGALFDKKRAERFDAPNRLLVEQGEEVEL